MEISELKHQLMQQARFNGICAEGYGLMRGYDRDSLIDYYVANPDWCLERNFPDMRMLADEFSDCESKGVFVGKTFHGEQLDELQTYIFHGCKGTIKVGLNIDKSIIPMFYIANGCRLRIVGVGQWVPARSRSVVPLYIFGKNDVSAKDNAYVKFNRFTHDLL